MTPSLLHLVDHLDRAEIEAPGRRHVQLQTFALNRVAKPTVFHHPPSRITWPEITLEAGARLVTHLAVKPSVWELIGGPVRFRVLVKASGEDAEVFSQTVDAKNNLAHRAWLPVTVSLDRWQGHTVQLVFETEGEDRPDVSHGWVGWGDPCVHGIKASPPSRSVGTVCSRPPGKPDIILITCDALRADHLGCYGAAGGVTPNIDRLAAEGVRFAHARSPSDTTLGTYASVLTGRPLHEHGVFAEWGELPAHLPSLPVALTGAGWHTLMAASEDELAAPASGMARAFAESLPCLGNPAQHSSVTTRRLLSRLRELDTGQPLFAWVQFFEPHPPVLPEAIYAEGVFTGDPTLPHEPENIARIRGVETLVDFNHSRAALAAGRLPFQMRQRLEDTVRTMRGTMKKGPDLASHLEAFGAPAWNGRSREGFIDWLTNELQLTAVSEGNASAALLEWLREIEPLFVEMEHDLLSWLDGVRDFRYPQALYAAAVCSVDDAVGRLTAELRTQGRYEEALIIFTAPHGEFLHEHPRIFEHHIPAEMVLRVPCIVKPPASLGWRKDCVVDGPVSISDLAATILDLADVPAAGALGRERSLRSELAGEKAVTPRDIISISMHGAMACIHREPFKLVRMHHSDLAWPWLENEGVGRTNKLSLFRTDPLDETRDLGAEHPSLVQELAVALEAVAPESACVPSPLEASLFHDTSRRTVDTVTFHTVELHRSAAEQDQRTITEQSRRSMESMQRESRKELKRLEADVKFLSRTLEQVRGALDQIYASRRWRMMNIFRRGAKRRVPAFDRLLKKFRDWKRNVRKTAVLAPVDEAYTRWLQAQRPDVERLREMTEKLNHSSAIMVFGLVLHASPDAKLSHVIEGIHSVRAQSFDRWRLYVIGASDTLRAELEEDARIFFLSAIAPSFPDEVTHFAVLGAGDWLEPHALMKIALALEDEDNADLVFSDEDEISNEGTLGNPFCKPAWSPDTLESTNCIGALAVWRSGFLQAIGVTLDSLHPHQAYTLSLRAAEHKGFRAVRVPEMLYHRRRMSGVERKALQSAEFTALNVALQRRGEFAKAVEGRHGVFHVSRALYKRERVAILIPTRDRLELLRRCLESLTMKTLYENYEIIIINNDSRDPWTQDWLRRCEHRVFDFHGPFNYAAMHNAVVKTVDAPWLCFLNNDTEIIEPHWLGAMCEHVQRPEIGAVGAKLLFPDGTVQHAGVVLGIHDRATHAFANLSAVDSRARAQLQMVRNYSAVTAACMMMRRAVFEELGGFDEQRFAVAYNDVDLCVRALRAGYRNVVTPHAVLKHHECASRPRVDHAFEVRHLRESVLGNTPGWSDPFYHPLLNHHTADFTVRVK